MVPHFVQCRKLPSGFGGLEVISCLQFGQSIILCLRVVRIDEFY